MNLHWWKIGSRPESGRLPRPAARGARRVVRRTTLALTRLEDRTVPDAVAISIAASGASATPNGVSSQPSQSSDGNVVAFTSAATNLVTGQTDANATTDVFLYNRQTGAATLISHAAGAGTTAANGHSLNPVVCADGRLRSYAYKYTHP